MMKFLKNNPKKLAVILVVAAVLVFAYWYGGDAPGSKGFILENENNAVSDTCISKNDNEQYDVNGQTEINTSLPNSETKYDVKSSETGEKNDNSSAKDTKKAEYKDAYDSRLKADDISDTEDSAGNYEELSEDNDTDGAYENNNIDEASDEEEKSDDGGTEKEGSNIPADEVTEQPDNQNVGSESATEASKNKDEQHAVYQKCTISISCFTILDNMPLLDASKADIVPADGWILKPITVEFSTGETVFDVLCRITKKYGIQLEYSYTPLYGSHYIEGLYNLYEFDCGNLSGWRYSVNGKFPNFGSSKYVLSDGDVIEWLYTCDLGEDIKKPN